MNGSLLQSQWLLHFIPIIQPRWRVDSGALSFLLMQETEVDDASRRYL